MISDVVQETINVIGEEAIEKLRSKVNTNLMSIAADKHLAGMLMDLIQPGYDGLLSENQEVAPILGNAIDFFYTNVIISAYDRQREAKKLQEQFEKEL